MGVSQCYGAERDPLKKECARNVILFGKQNCFSCNYDEVILEEGGSLISTSGIL